MITFEECQHVGYKARTVLNARADVTIALASDFNTAGERCTFNAVRSANKLYIPVRLKDILNLEMITSVSNQINNNVYGGWTLNIAGNGIYSLRLSQEVLDKAIRQFLDTLFAITISKPVLVRSGGQTGVDEAGAKAAAILGIPTVILAPYGWLYRDKNGYDIRDEQSFKSRFILTTNND